MRTVAPPPPATDDLDVHRLVLRDGSTASLRMADAGDDLSSESHYRRFLTAGEPPDAIIEHFCDLSDPSRGLITSASICNETVSLRA